MNVNVLASALFVSVCIIWGTTWFAMEVALYSIPPIFATALRFILAVPVLFACSRVFNQPVMFPKNKYGWVFVVAVFYFSIPFTLMIYGEKYISSGLASIIFSNMPIAVMLMSILFLSLRFTLHQVIGLLCAIVSLCLILSNEMQVSGESSIIGVVSIITAVIIHSVMYVLVRKYLRDVHVITYNTIPCLIASLLLFVVSFVFEEVYIYEFTLSSVCAVLYLGVIASVGGIVAYFKLGQISNPFHASLCFLVFPLVALGISYFVKNNTISNDSILLILPLFLGVLLTKLPKECFDSAIFNNRNDVETK